MFVLVVLIYWNPFIFGVCSILKDELMTGLIVYESDDGERNSSDLIARVGVYASGGKV